MQVLPPLKNTVQGTCLMGGHPQWRHLEHVFELLPHSLSLFSTHNLKDIDCSFCLRSVTWSYLSHDRSLTFAWEWRDSEIPELARRMIHLQNHGSSVPLLSFTWNFYFKVYAHMSACGENRRRSAKLWRFWKKCEFIVTVNLKQKK